jgi:hypothetical protein
MTIRVNVRTRCLLQVIFSSNPRPCIAGHVPDDHHKSDYLSSSSPPDSIFGDVGSPVATVYLEGASARVIVEEIEKLIRSPHLRDFEFPHLPGRPDVDVTVDLTEVIEAEGELLRTAPQRLTPPHARTSYGPPRVIRAHRRNS